MICTFFVGRRVAELGMYVLMCRVSTVLSGNVVHLFRKWDYVTHPSASFSFPFQSSYSPSSPPLSSSSSSSFSSISSSPAILLPPNSLPPFLLSYFLSLFIAVTSEISLRVSPRATRNTSKDAYCSRQTGQNQVYPSFLRTLQGKGSTASYNTLFVNLIHTGKGFWGPSA